MFNKLKKKFNIKNKGEHMKIGKKIKALRLQKNLTLQELASRSEVTKGFLSQLERDLTSPNIQALEDILEALGTNLSEFFKEEKEEKMVFTNKDYFIDERENETIEWIVPNAQKNAMEPILLTIKPGKRTSLITSFDGEAFGYILKGVVTLMINEKAYKVKAKETFYVSGNKSHYLKNHTKQDVTLLWITTPPQF